MNRSSSGLLRDERTVLWTVFLVALGVRVAIGVVLDGFRHPNVSEYDTIARNMLAGRGFTFEQLGVVYHSYIAPLPAWLTAGSYWLADSLVPAMCVQVLAGALLAPVTATLARRLFGGWVAPLAAGLLVAVHPGLALYSAAKMHALVFDALFFTLTVLQSLRIAEKPGAGRAAVLGVIVGIGTLSRATIVIFLPIAAVWLMLTVPARWRWRALKSMLVAGVCAAAIVAPWSIRNTMVNGRFVFLLTTSGEVFWRGNNPYASGTSYADDRHIILEMLPPDEMADLTHQPNEIAQERWFNDHARAFIRAHPWTFVGLALRKFFYFWWFSPSTGLLYPRTWLRLYQTYYVGALVLAAVGAGTLLRRGSDGVNAAALVFAFMLALSGLQSLYYVEGRHRWAIEPMLLALSAGGLARLARGLGRDEDAANALWDAAARPPC